MVPPCSDRISRVPPYSSVPHIIYFRVRDYHPLLSIFPDCSTSFICLMIHWAVPFSLAATQRISVDFFSSGYLDVSVPQVRLFTLYIQVKIPSTLGGFPHSEIPGSKLVCQLTGAYRRLLRPSSPVTAKASTVCA